MLSGTDKTKMVSFIEFSILCSSFIIHNSTQKL